MCNLINIHTYIHTLTYQQQLHQRRGIHRLPRPGFGACRRCLRPRERDKNSTCRSASRRRWGGGGGRERSEGERGGRGGGGIGQREQWEDPLATQPDREIKLSQTN